MASVQQSNTFPDTGTQLRVALVREQHEADITARATSGAGAVVEALDGRALTRGTADIIERATGWTARLAQLDRPGVVASLFFAERARDVVLRLDDGRAARARISSTSFVATSERVCDLVGVESLA